MIHRHTLLYIPLAYTTNTFSQCKRVIYHIQTFSAQSPLLFNILGLKIVASVWKVVTLRYANIISVRQTKWPKLKRALQSATLYIYLFSILKKRGAYWVFGWDWRLPCCRFHCCHNSHCINHVCISHVWPCTSTYGYFGPDVGRLVVYRIRNQTRYPL